MTQEKVLEGSYTEVTSFLAISLGMLGFCTFRLKYRLQHSK